MLKSLLVTLFILCSGVETFTVPSKSSFHRATTTTTTTNRKNGGVANHHKETTTTTTNNDIISSQRMTSLDDSNDGSPQVFATGYSSKSDLMEAIAEAVDQATASLPKLENNDMNGVIDLAWITTSSLYDASFSSNLVVPTLLSSSLSNRRSIQNVIGCSTGGIVSCRSRRDTDDNNDDEKKRECQPLENEGLLGVSVTLCLLPNVDVTTFHTQAEDVPDDVGRVSVNEWKRSVGLSQLSPTSDKDSDYSDDEIFMLIPSAAFQKDLNDFVDGLKYTFPSSTILGALASTVSSLSRARLFCYSATSDDSDDLNSAYGDGCVGVALKGDIQVKVSVAQGAKPVGGIYRIVSGQDSTISAIQLDEVATQQEATTEDDNIEDEDDDDEDDDNMDDDETRKKKQLVQAYAKASIPKPVLAEANYLMKTLSDDDAAFMSRALLVGLERGGAMGQSPSQLIRLAQGKGHSFTVHQVASAGMKDGSVTLPLGSVSVERGTRLRFFVRDGKFAKKELEALWTGYKKQIFEETFLQQNTDNDDQSDEKQIFTPTGCIMFTTLDRGSKLFGGKPGYESSVVSDFLPSIPSISGFFSNGVIARLDNQKIYGDENQNNDDAAMIHGSASCFALFGSKTNRPIYSPSQAAATAKRQAQKEAEAAALANDDNTDSVDDISQQPSAVVSAISDNGDAVVAPRDKNNELIIRRREVHSGRALTVSTVEWSVAENVAKPTSVLESFMWEKETEVDRLRERVPLANLVSQWKLSMVDPSMPKPRDWIGPIHLALANSDNNFVLIPECKRMEPTTGSLRKRYNLPKLVKQLTNAGAPALSVNCDAILYGGKLEDITVAREASTSAALSQVSTNDINTDDGVVSPPILASDLLLYPYQLYKLRLAGADATNLQVAALEDKDLLYMTKIASSLQMQLVASVTSEIQIEKVTKLSPENNSIRALVVSNRNMENFSFDETGEQVLRLLKSKAMEEFRAKHKDVLILVEGKIGIIERECSSSGKRSSAQYIKELIEANANGAIVGSGLAMKKEDDGGAALKKILMDVQIG